MVKQLIQICKNNRWFLIALIISILLHFSIITKLKLSIPEQSPSSQNFTVTLNNTFAAPVEPVNSVTQAVELNNEPEQAVAPPTIKPTELPKEDKPALNNETIAPIQESQNLANKAKPNDLITPSDHIPTEKNLEETPANSASNSTQFDKPSPPTYQYLELSYDILNGHDKSIGKSNINLTLEVNGTYILNEIQRYQAPNDGRQVTKTFKSNGVVSESGLIPGYFASQTSQAPQMNHQLLFAWPEGFINVQANTDMHQLPLTSGTQDPISYKYQLMFNAFEMPFFIIEKGQLKELHFKLIADEVISTKAGDLKCFHIQSVDGTSKYDLWLAKDYQRLPIKWVYSSLLGSIEEETIINKIDFINKQ